jgi:hypothetical protein
MLHDPTTIYMVFETTMYVYEDLNTIIQIAAEKMWLCWGYKRGSFSQNWATCAFIFSMQNAA